MKSGTDATVSCVITGIKALAIVEWLGPSGRILLDDEFIINPGPYESDDKRQTTTLEVKGPAVTEDKTYTCRVRSSISYESPPSNTNVQLNEYGTGYIEHTANYRMSFF